MKHLEYLKQRARKKSPDIKIFALGGLGAVGMNMYVVEVNDEINYRLRNLVADGEALGVDYIIPNFQYLIENEEKDYWSFQYPRLTRDHIGGIPFLLKKVKMLPVV